MYVSDVVAIVFVAVAIFKYGDYDKFRMTCR